MEIINIYKKFYFLASVKNQLMKILLDREFLKSNFLHFDENEDNAKEHLIY